MNKRQQQELASQWGARIRWNEDMAGYCTLRAGGRADALIEVKTPAELAELLAQLQRMQLPGLVLGHGSNILISDRGYHGVVIRLQGEFKVISPLEEQPPGDGKVRFRVGAGCSMAGLLSWCTRQGLAGLEFMAGIPGSVGGAIRMNAGAWGHAIGERVVGVAYTDNNGRLHEVPAAELRFSYRRLALQQGGLSGAVITSVLLELDRGDGEDIRRRCRQYIEQRQGKQPGGVASAGSFFKNPPQDAAGRLIEAAGLKGLSCGKAMVSPVHANFIVNTGGASATDIISLMEEVQSRVLQQFGIRLEPEVRIIEGTEFGGI